ncbi:hypothetical protein WEB32_03885 [Streptomyces netropsis]|uniref:V8-like Glu-specific endopeptidase n=1 Tax=Streptomyces netropsis TaxID=55404 RepID=A0A7W7LBS3_STRNE|nr:hypothetical protein [Streptomyces netropsis]MBB4887319.1 hypothetical protein [Streptomyces netropsis]GGR09436.1 hypothetical protein GCM10010219_12480 [Streptomyces netropsis]
MIKRLCTFLLSLAVIWTLGVGAAQAAAEQGKRVHNAMQIIFSPSMPDAFCTIGAVGTDKYGHKIAVSAGHCLRDPEYADREIHDDIAPVYDRADTGFGPIGYVRYFKDPEGSQTGHVTKDYMIIELGPKVTLSSQGPYLKQTGMLKVPGGIVSPNALNPALDNERLLAPGGNELITSGQTGVWYGTIMESAVGVYRSAAFSMKGDSGGPAIWRVPGSALPSQANNFQASGPWAGITKGITLALPPFLYTSSANILADLRARDAAAPTGVFGAGFTVTANP